jgi:hypothetical protein
MMIKSQKSKWSVLVFSLSLAAAMPLFAQNGPPGGGGGPGGQGGPGGDPNGGPGGPGGPPNFADHKQHELQDIQEDMDLADDKWKSLEPKLEKVMDLHEELSPHHGPPRPDEQDDKNASPVSKALDELREALDDKDAKADDIQAKVDAYEKAKSAAADELKKAEDDLKAGLTPVEQAILIAHGVLD